jgi:hypothetical protein
VAAIAPHRKVAQGRLAFLLISKIYRQMYANTGIATDSARVNRSAQWARLMVIPCRWLFAGRPMPELQVPTPAAAAKRTSWPLIMVEAPSPHD